MQAVNNDVLLGKVKVANNWTAMELKKLKKDFTNIMKEKPQNLKIIKEAYINYLVEADKRK